MTTPSKLRSSSDKTWQYNEEIGGRQGKRGLESKLAHKARLSRPWFFDMKLVLGAKLTIILLDKPALAHEKELPRVFATDDHRVGLMIVETYFFATYFIGTYLAGHGLSFLIDHEKLITQKYYKAYRRYQRLS